MSAARARLRSVPVRALLVGATGAMAFCARAPEAGAGWRTGFVLAALTASFALALAWRKGGYSTRGVLGLALVLRLLVFPLPPALSDDGYRYVWDGRVQMEAGLNPYRYVPSDPALSGLRDEVVFPRLNSANYFSVYPPLSQLVFAVGGLAFPLGWKWSWYLVKLIVGLAEVGGLWLLSRMVKPEALVLYAWNPLVVIETAGQAHADALTVPLLVLAVWAVRGGRGGTAAAALVAAGWVKLVPFVLVPFVVRRFGLRALVPAALLGGVLTLPYAADYVIPNVRVSLDLYVRLFEFNAGPYYALKGVLLASTGSDWSKTLGPALQAVFLIGVAGLYLSDVRRKWEDTAFPMVLVLGGFLACGTTVHPWYMLPLLALLPFLAAELSGRKHAAAWLWLGAWTLATYWRYAGPAWAYPAAVAVGWTGWAFGLTGASLEALLPVVMRRRAAWKWRWIAAHLPAPFPYKRVLDLGAGEGYVGEIVSRETRAEVTLADVVDFNRTALPFVRYDGRTLPFSTGAFDLTLVVFVLHHARDAEQVLAEARRVTNGPLMVIESVAEGKAQRWLFERSDRLANAVRSGGAMAAQEAWLEVRSDEAWQALFAQLGLRVQRVSGRGRGVHRQRLYSLVPLLQ